MDAAIFEVGKDVRKADRRRFGIERVLEADFTFVRHDDEVFAPFIDPINAVWRGLRRVQSLIPQKA